jgi:hypothetical protein
MGAGQKVGFRHTEDAKNRISEGMKGKKNGFQKKIQCEDCGEEMTQANMPRHKKACAECFKWARLFKSKKTPQQMKSFRISLRKYGIDVEHYAFLFDEQGGVCKICGDAPVSGRLNVDHCHETNEVRGLLCDSCNITIGVAKESPSRLRACGEYVAINRAMLIDASLYDP